MSNKATIRASLILFALILPASAQPQTITGKVVGVSDGDTITVLDAGKRQHKIRLDGIDAPESNQDWGSRAKQMTALGNLEMPYYAHLKNEAPLLQ